MKNIRLFIGTNLYWFVVVISLFISSFVDLFLNIKIFDSWQDFIFAIFIYFVIRYTIEFIFKNYIALMPIDKRLLSIYLSVYRTENVNNLIPEQFINQFFYFLPKHQKEELLNNINKL